MNFRNLVAAAAALTLTTTPVLAADVSRASAPVSEESQFGGNSDSTFLLILAIVLIGAGIFVLANNNSDSPTSP